VIMADSMTQQTGPSCDLLPPIIVIYSPFVAPQPVKKWYVRSRRFIYW
jgi:hypothetical protein